MILNKIILIMLISSISVFAQDIGTTEIKVMEGFTPVIPPASRLNENATFADTLKKDRTQVYDLLDISLNSDYKTKPLKVAQVKDDKLPELYATEVGVGFGNAFTTKANIVHNSKRSKTLSYGVIANHFANKYFPSEDLAKSSKNSMHLFAKKIQDSYIFILNMDYDRNTALYSYVDAGFGLMDEEYYRNRFAFTKFSVSVLSQESSKEKLKHNSTFFISDLNEFSENQISLSTNLSKKNNNFGYALEITFDNYLRYNNSDSKVENTDLKILGFSPNVSFNRFGIDFDLGFDCDIDHDFSFGFFPVFKATKELVNDVVLIYGGLSHGEQLHTLKSLSDENPYIHSFATNQTMLEDSIFLQDLEITDVQELYLGMRNVLARGDVFQGYIAYGIVTNFAHFIRYDTERYNRFYIAYVDKNVTQLHVNANYSKKINEIVSLNTSVDYFNWDVDVYHKPNFIVDLNVPINLRDKIKVAPSIRYIGERKVANVVNDDYIFSHIPSLIHINLGVNYSYSKQLSVYFELNNLSNSKQDLWFGYREVGFNGAFGLNFSF